MNANVQAIKKELQRLGNKEIAEHSQRFFKTGKGQYGEGDRFLGIRVPVLRKVARKYRGLPINQVEQLLRSEFHEVRLLALLMLVESYKQSDEQGRKTIFSLYLDNTRYINNWDLVDSSAEHIVGAYLFQRDRKVLYRLARSSGLWKRRIAIMATFHFIRNNDFADTINIALILLDDNEDLIHKAVGWMLREVGKRDMPVEEEFLQKNYNRIPRTMLRYAIEKFPAEKRKGFLRGRV